ncbi:uncharacterized protein CC84DRAFT_1174124 [Paraphaeosphaeria sporulosa]|uniref:AB hydrolase-1 domain-containing protein n=1 Tax=Paraphaeosphaeria sporulosa TaxID=1460663 RepID=A0A177CPI0_9PLEO|nr:uncharacterized protein CC84DRAFT_1174124 [Paraphaeosphaeria sporulosa]OAG08677.1 hypothetical protein CC84DRAFT_1174124 [Paraphaeosphaeria sporulosa]
MATNFSAVICHGYYHTPGPYQNIIDTFNSRGIEAYCPQLATSDLSKLNVGDVAHPNFDLGPPTSGYPTGEDDVEILLNLFRQLIEKDGKRVLLIAHSAGGWAATQAAIPELQAKTRSGKGLSGGIIGIFYYGAFIIPVGESIHSFFQPKDAPAIVPSWLKYHAYGPEGLGTLFSPEKFMFNDLNPEEAARWTRTLTASPPAIVKLTNDAYMSLPCAYLVLEGDQTLAKEYQEGMVMLQASKTGEFKMYRCPAGHSAHLSWTSGLVDTVQDFMGNLNQQ